MRTRKNLILSVLVTIVSIAVFKSAFATRDIEIGDLRTTIDQFLATRCQKSIQVLATKEITETRREVAPGESDYIYDVKLRVSWQTDQGRTLEETLSLSVVNLARSVDYKWFVFDGSGQSCNFKGLPGYSR